MHKIKGKQAMLSSNMIEQINIPVHQSCTVGITTLLKVDKEGPEK